MFCKVFMISLN